MSQINKLFNVEWVDPDRVSEVVNSGMDKVLVIDSRSFLEYNTCHVLNSINVVCSKIVKRRLQQDKISVKDFLANTCHVEADCSYEVIVYDQGTSCLAEISPDSFVHILLSKLSGVFKVVSMLKGGFLEFQAAFPFLCEDETRKCASLTSLSQPCLSANNLGPTRILPFLYLGSQNDAANREILKDHDITYELNVSTNCPKPDFISDHKFMRIPVNDNYSEKLLPHFNKAFHFLDKVRQGNCCVLVHCLAGISRSPTIAIAYVMRHLRVSSEEAYRYVKSKRASISPNFNFLGQLLEYEKQLKVENVNDIATGCTPAPVVIPPGVNGHKRQCLTDVRSSNKLTLNLPVTNSNTEVGFSTNTSTGDLSPTSGLARLSFGEDVKNENAENQSSGKESTSETPFVPKMQLSVTTNAAHREKRCISELFLKKTTTINELIESNPIKAWSPLSWSACSSSETCSSDDKSSSASSSADSGFEMMVDEKPVRLRRPLFPTKSGLIQVKKECIMKDYFRPLKDYISKTNISLEPSKKDLSSTKESVFAFPKAVSTGNHPENLDSTSSRNKFDLTTKSRKQGSNGNSMKVKEDGLYRAQSCPGILNCFCYSSASSAKELTMNPLVVALSSAGSIRRKCKRDSEKSGYTKTMERVVNCNRYSWENLDFGKLERLLNSDSCPDFGQITSPNTSPRRGKEIPSVIKVS